MIKSKKFTGKEFSWILYDVANSAFALLVMTAVMPIFFKNITKGVISEAESTSYYGYTNSIATFLLALTAPFLGALADLRFWKKRLLTAITLLGGILCCSMYFMDECWILLLVVYGLGRYCFAGSNVFYDSFLVDAVDDEQRFDWVSSSGFAFGYIGGVLPFIIFVILTHFKLLNVKSAFVIAGVWWIVFSLPLLLKVKQRHYVEAQGHIVKDSFKRLWGTVRKIFLQSNIFLFLLAYFFYIDGVDTIFTMAMVYGSDLGIGSMSMMALLVVIQIIAFPFALLYGKMTDYFKTKTLIYFAIGVFVLCSIGGSFISSFESLQIKEIAFWGLGLAVATSQGGIQALSRSYFCRMVPENNATEFFGFYNIFGKFAVFLGPLIWGALAQATGESRWGIISLLPLFIIGAVLLYFVKEPAE